MIYRIFIFLAAMFLVACGSAPIAQPQSLLSIDVDLLETRYCGTPKRDANGRIIRRSAVITAYKKIHPCPSTGLYGSGACPDYSLNHNMPLACGGCDSVSNLMYMRNDAKKIVDGYEREISALNPPIEDTAACVNKVQP
jgi:hypothetical protein